MMKSDLLPEALDQRWDKYNAELGTSRKEFSEQAVHDLRVATRRLLAALELVRALVQHPRTKKLARVFKLQLDGFDELRDMQVMLAGISEKISGLPELQPFQAHLQKREKRLLRAARKQVKTIKPGSLHKRVLTIREMIVGFAAQPRSSARLLQAVDDAYHAVLQRREHVDLATPPTIHRLRIAFKNLRHMVEIVLPLLPGFPEENLKRMHDLQTAMGEIQDCEVAMRTLSDFAAQAKSFEAAPVRLFYEQRLAPALAALPARLGEIDGFWRAGPARAFPWKRRPAIKSVKARRPRSSI